MRQDCNETPTLRYTACMTGTPKSLQVIQLTFAAFFFSLFGCSERPQTIEINDAGSWADVLVPGLFSPYELDALIQEDIAELQYGFPKDSGGESGKSSRSWWYEYVGDNGRIRMTSVVSYGEGGDFSADLIDLYPGGLYLNDVIERRYLSKIEVDPLKSGAWNVVLKGKQHSWFVLLDMDGRAVRRIHISY